MSEYIVCIGVILIMGITNAILLWKGMSWKNKYNNLAIEYRSLKRDLCSGWEPKEE
jgi:hypothetical protein